MISGFLEISTFECSGRETTLSQNLSLSMYQRANISVESGETFTRKTMQLLTTPTLPCYNVSWDSDLSGIAVYSQPIRRDTLVGMILNIRIINCQDVLDC